MLVQRVYLAPGKKQEVYTRSYCGHSTASNIELWSINVSITVKRENLAQTYFSVVRAGDLLAQTYFSAPPVSNKNVVQNLYFLSQMTYTMTL